jgi:hypothetical protein
MKCCSICKELKSLDFFGRDRYKKDGLTVSCKPCNKLVRNGYRVPPPPIILEKTCKQCSTAKSINEYYKHCNTCRSCVSENYRKKRVLKVRVYSTNPKSIYKRNKRQTDPLFKLSSNIGTLIANCLNDKGYKKNKSTIEILGCSIQEFKQHLESQFLPGMTWDDRDQWHIDHIVPKHLATTEDQVLLLNHYSNLRPLWSLDNLQKAGSITEEVKTHPLYAKLYTP